MSATGRNLEGRERHEDDFYETPAWCTRAILSVLYPPSGDPGASRTYPPLVRPRTILDAGAGTGAILRACGSFFMFTKGMLPPAILQGVEQNKDRVQQANEYEPYPDRDDLRFDVADFFSVRGLIDEGELSLCDRRGNERFDLVISNPPYSDAERFVEHALKVGRTVCFLLRLNWLASKKRAAFHRAHPSGVYVLPRRPSFTGGGTDATEYAWFVWGEGQANRWFLLEVEE